MLFVFVCVLTFPLLIYNFRLCARLCANSRKADDASTSFPFYMKRPAPGERKRGFFGKEGWELGGVVYAIEFHYRSERFLFFLLA